MLTADRKITQREGRLIGLLVAAASLIYGGALVCLNAAGYAVKGADQAGLKFMGLARGRADNSAGGPGAAWVEVYTRDDQELKIDAAATQADVGKYVYVKDDETVTLKPKHNVLVGRIMEVVSTTRVMVRPILDADLPDVISLPVDASQLITAEEFVCFNAAGMAEPGDDAAALTFAGIANHTADNQAGSAGQINVQARQDKYLVLDLASQVGGSAITAAALGDQVYLSTATTVALVSSVDNDVPVGTLVRINEAEGWAVVRLESF